MYSSNAPPPPLAQSCSLPPSLSLSTTNSTHCLFPLRCAPPEATAVSPSSVDWKTENEIRATRHSVRRFRSEKRPAPTAPGPSDSVRFCTRRRRADRQNGKDHEQLSLNRCKYIRDIRYFRTRVALRIEPAFRAFSSAATRWKRARGVVIKAVVDKTETWLSVWPTFGSARLRTLRKIHRYVIDSALLSAFERSLISVSTL